MRKIFVGRLIGKRRFETKMTDIGKVKVWKREVKLHLLYLSALCRLEQTRKLPCHKKITEIAYKNNFYVSR
jgi:hypothetical protein